MVRRRHWVNTGRGGETAFVTTTCLDFVHALAKPGVRDLAAAWIAESCRRSGSLLHVFVVMPHHVHLLVTPPPGLPVTRFVQGFKSGAARRIRPLLDRGTESGFDQQRGLNRHVFWQRSFRSVAVASRRVFDAKAEYIHWNPVKAGLCARPDEYRWSSLPCYASGLAATMDCLDPTAVRDRYAPFGMPPV